MNAAEGQRTDGQTPVPMLLDAHAAAGYLGISTAMLRAATHAGEITAAHLRGRGSGARDAVRWRRVDLDTWVERSMVPAGSTEQRTATPPAVRALHAVRAPRAVGTRGKAAPLMSARAAIRATAA